MLRRNIYAAREGARAIHDQKLAVIAHVEKGHAPRHPGMEKAAGGNSSGLQAVQAGGKEISDADAVQQHSNFDAAIVRIDQGL